MTTTSQGSIQVKLLSTWQDIRSIRHLWDDLVAQSALRSPFLTYDWCEAWWTAFSDSRELFFLSFLGPQDELVGIAPLHRTSHPDHTNTRLPLKMIRFLGTGTGGDSTSLGLLMRRGYEALGARQFLQWLARARSEWDLLDLHYMPSECLPTKALTEELTRNRWLHIQRGLVHLSVSLPEKYGDYLGSLSKKIRTRLPYEHRRLLKHFGVAIRKIREEAELPPALDALFQMNTQRWHERGERGSFATRERRLFAQEIARRFLSLGLLDFWYIELNGRIAAIECALRYKDTYYALWAALDTNFYPYSPGTVLKAHIIEQLIQDGVRTYDFRQGDEPYKMHWGPETQTYTKLLCTAPRTIGAMYLRASAWNSAARTRAASIPSQCKEGLRSVLPATMWNALRTVRKGFRSHNAAG